jgi:hypothetical protein
MKSAENPEYLRRDIVCLGIGFDFLPFLRAGQGKHLACEKKWEPADISIQSKFSICTHRTVVRSFCRGSWSCRVRQLSTWYTLFTCSFTWYTEIAIEFSF